MKVEYGVMKVWQVWFADDREYDLIIAPNEEIAKEVFYGVGSGQAPSEVITKIKLIPPERVLNVFDDVGETTTQTAAAYASGIEGQMFLASSLFWRGGLGNRSLRGSIILGYI